MSKPIIGFVGTGVMGESMAGHLVAAGHTVHVHNRTKAKTDDLVRRGARRAGLDPTTVLLSIGSGAASSWSLTNLAPRIIRGDFEPGFYVKHFIKDMTLALEAAGEMGLDARGLALARDLYEEVARAGLAEKGTQALYKRYDG